MIALIFKIDKKLEYVCSAAFILLSEVMFSPHYRLDHAALVTGYIRPIKP